jgi:hypothetical protein
LFEQECVFQELSVSLRDVFSRVGLKRLLQGDGVSEKLRIRFGEGGIEIEVSGVVALLLSFLSL